MQKAQNFISSTRYLITISRPNLSTKVIESRSSSNVWNFIIHFLQLHSCILLQLCQRSRSSESQCHLMWRSWQFQMTKMSTYLRCFCDLCVVWMVCFWLKSILVLSSISVSNGKKLIIQIISRVGTYFSKLFP